LKGMDARHYRELVVWQKAMDLVEEVYKLVKWLPKEELHALSDQMRRAAVSIPSNIAEGQARNSTKEFIQFLPIAQGSKAELQTQILLCERLNYLTREQIKPALVLTEEVGKMAYALKQKLLAVH
jgi:four helix bundle protein